MDVRVISRSPVERTRPVTWGGYVTRISGAHRQASFDQVQLDCVVLLLVTLDST